MDVDSLKRFLGPLDRRVRSMIMRATVTGVDDTQDLQQLQVTRLAGEVLEGCERIGQYGLTSVPPAGAEAIVGQVSSNADHQVILGVDDRSRPHPLAAGQTCLYDGAGTTLMLNADGTVTLTSADRVTVVTPAIILYGDVVIDGTLLVSGAADFESTLNGHTP